MAKEQFHYPATQSLFKKLEQLRQRSGISRSDAFQDWLTAMVCVLAAETKEDEYLAMVERHKQGKVGQRGVDLMVEMFGDLVNAITREDVDILGDLFQGAVSYGENGLYVTPASVAALMASMSIDAEDDSDVNPTVCDPCCGTGILLMEAAKINSNLELVGQDIDARCAKITSINLSLRGRYGWVVCGNALSGEAQFAYRIAPFFNESPNGLRRGMIRDVPPESTPIPVIASRMRSTAKDLFEQRELGGTPTELSLPTIIEVPKWLARLEPTLATLDRSETMSTVEHQLIEKEPARDTGESLKKQQDLF